MEENSASGDAGLRLVVGRGDAGVEYLVGE